MSPPKARAAEVDPHPARTYLASFKLPVVAQELPFQISVVSTLAPEYPPKDKAAEDVPQPAR